jgi:hypothetical protein
MIKSIFFILLLVGFVSAQIDTKQPDVWKPMKFFVGNWEGIGKGEPGESKIEREYKFVLNGKFLQASHKSVYAPRTG